MNTRETQQQRELCMHERERDGREDGDKEREDKEDLRKKEREANLQRGQL